MPDRLKRQRWAARRAAGLCGECGHVPSGTFSRCGLCRAFISEQRRAWWRRNKMHLRAQRRAEYRAHVEERKAKARADYYANHEKELARARRRHAQQRAA